MLYFTGYLRVALTDIHVDFGSNSEGRKVDARLNREASSCDDPAVIVRFQIVHVRTGAVNFLANGVPSAVNEVVAKTFFLNVAAAGVVHFESVDEFAVADRVFDAFDGAVTPTCYNFEHVL